MFGHDDLVGSERNERPARHCIMRHEHADLGFVFMDRPRDLQCGEYDAAWSVQDDVEWNFIVRHLDRAQDLLGVADINVAHNREAKQPHRFLPMNEEDHTRVPLTLQLSDLPRAHHLEHALAQPRLKRCEYKKQPEDIAYGHESLLWHAAGHRRPHGSNPRTIRDHVG